MKNENLKSILTLIIVDEEQSLKCVYEEWKLKQID